MRLHADRIILLRRIVVWMLAFVVPMQVLAVGLLQVRGPSHAHVQAVDDGLHTADFRRQVGGGTRSASPKRWLVDLLHGHAHAETQHHHHAFDDPSVRYADGDRFGDVPGDDHGVTVDHTGTFIPLPATRADAPEPSTEVDAAFGRAWTPTSAVLPPLDRPPRPLAV